VNLVQRTIDEDRVRKEAKRAWRAQQAFNEAKKKAEAGAKQAVRAIYICLTFHHLSIWRVFDFSVLRFWPQ